MEEIIGILGAISIFWFGYEVGKFKGLAKAEKLFEKSIDKRISDMKRDRGEVDGRENSIE